MGLAREEVVVARPLVHVVLWPGWENIITLVAPCLFWTDIISSGVCNVLESKIFENFVAHPPVSLEHLILLPNTVNSSIEARLVFNF